VVIMVRHAHDIAIPPSLRRPDRDISPELDRVVLRALDKRPEARFPDASTFARELRAAAARLSPWRDGSALAAPTCDCGAPAPGRRLARGSTAAPTLAARNIATPIEAQVR